MAQIITAEQIERMKKLRDDGLSYRAIGREIGCTGTTVKSYLVPGAREKNREQCHKYCVDNREAINEAAHKYREKNSDAISKRRRERGGDRNGRPTRRSYCANISWRLTRSVKFSHSLLKM